jgi:hypothetical protein
MGRKLLDCPIHWTDSDLLYEIQAAFDLPIRFRERPTTGCSHDSRLPLVRHGSCHSPLLARLPNPSQRVSRMSNRRPQ